VTESHRRGRLRAEWRAQWHSAGLRPGWSGIRVPKGAGNFSLTTASRPALGPIQPPIQWVPVALPLWVKRPRREADSSPPSSAVVKNAWSYTSTPQYALRRSAQIKHKKKSVVCNRHGEKKCSKTAKNEGKWRMLMWEDNTKLYHKCGMRMWTGFFWLKGEVQ
jgi:hypothetical protein